mgnify:CR=1 FL=1
MPSSRVRRSNRLYQIRIEPVERARAAVEDRHVGAGASRDDANSKEM